MKQLILISLLILASIDVILVGRLPFYFPPFIFLNLLWYQFTFRLHSKANFFILICLLMGISLTHIIHKDFMASRLAIYAFVFLLLGIIKMRAEEASVRMRRNLYDPVGTMQKFAKLLLKKYSSLLLPKDALHTLLLLALFAAIFLPFYGLQDIRTAIMNLRSKNAVSTQQDVDQITPPSIQKVEPGIAYPTLKVVIYGNDFGSKQGTSLLLHNGKAIKPLQWSDTRVVFAIPKNWKYEDNYVVMQKGAGRNIQQQQIAVSVIKKPRRFQDNPAFAAQLKTLDRETIRINGYFYEN